MNKEKSAYAEMFDIARKAYPGIKRGLVTEFEYFRKKHKEWVFVLPLLKPAIDQQVQRREAKKRSNKFVPPWKNFKTWIYNKSWEETEGVTESPEERATKERIKRNREGMRRRQKERDEQQSWLENKTTAALLDLKADKGARVAHWLIDEIISKRGKE